MGRFNFFQTNRGISVDAVDYKGSWNATSNTPALANTDGPAKTGNMYIVSVAGTHNFGAGAITFAAGDYVIYSGSVWQKIKSSTDVVSVFGRVGVVTAQSGDYTAAQVGLGNVTNDAQLKASQLDTDNTLAANSDTRVSSQKAVKAYIDGAEAGAIATAEVYTDSAIASHIEDAIVDGHTLIAASSNAVFDALALKEALTNKDTDVLLAANSDTRYASQKAVKAYIDALKFAPVKAVVMGQELSTSPPQGLGTYNGYTLQAGDRVLVPSGGAVARIGIWVAASGSWTRATDLTVAADGPSGKLVYVGSSQTDRGQKYWKVINDTAVNPGITGFAFQQQAVSNATIGSGIAYSTQPDAIPLDFTAKGQLLVGTDTLYGSLAGGANTRTARLSPGADGKYLKTNSSLPEGVEWSTVSAAPGVAAVIHKLVNYNSGDINLTSTNWVDVPFTSNGGDMAIQASIGDVIEFSINALVNDIVGSDTEFDVYCTTSGNTWGHSPASGSADPAGISGFRCPNSGSTNGCPLTGSYRYTVVSGDISGGTVNVRMRYRARGTHLNVLLANSNYNCQLALENKGPAAA